MHLGEQTTSRQAFFLVFKNECNDPNLNDCPSTSICIDQFYGFACQCKPGLVDKSPNIKENPGRVCEPATDGDGGGDGSEAAQAGNVVEETATTPKSARKNKSRRVQHSNSVSVQ